MENWQKDRLRRIASIANAHISAGSKVLDIGCYNRHILPLLKPGIKYTGVDINGECDVRVDLNQGKLPFKDNSFDFVICAEIFEHIVRPKALLKEIRRVLKPEGYAVSSIPNENHVIIRLRRLFNIRYSSLVFDENPQRHMHSPRLSEAAEFVKSEFEIVKKEYYTPKLWLQFIANLWPSAFARGTIFEVRKK